MALGGDAASAESAIPARFLAAPSTLYVVATPLGNLRDLSFRARRCSRQRGYDRGRGYARDQRAVAALRHRDARRSRSTSTTKRRARHAIVEELGAGRSVALVSDAGTPAISDPGARLVRAVRDAGFAVVPIPGACAAIAAVSAAGLAAEHWLFLGFLPSAAKARRELLASVARMPAALVIYEAPHRVRATAAELGAALGGERPLVVAREITKKFETIAVITLGGGAGLVRRRSQSRARRIRAGGRRACRAGRRDRRIAPSTLAGC